MSKGRSIGAGIAGTIVAVLAIVVWQMAGHRIWPFPGELDLGNPEDVERLLASLPLAALIWIPAGYALGTLVGAAVAARLASALRPALIVGMVILVLTILNFFAAPHPTWMIIAGIVVPLPAAWLGARLALARQAAD